MVLSCSVENHDAHLYEKDLITTRTDTPPIELETKMQWTSFMAAAALDLDPLARAEFMALTSGLTNTISLKKVLKPSSIAPNFKAKFLELLDSYSMYICGTGKPEIGEVPQTMAQDPICAAEFLQYIYNDNCLEFYFPKGLVLNPILPITSTAHPMTQANSNYGFKRHQKIPGVTILSKMKVNSSYLSSNKDIVVVRPIDGSVDCDYSDYGVENFTLFLAN